MKKLSKDEMKKVSGGLIDPQGCAASCSEKVGSTVYVGTCSSTTTKSGTFCVCSRSGGTGC